MFFVRPPKRQKISTSVPINKPLNPHQVDCRKLKYFVFWEDARKTLQMPNYSTHQGGFQVFRSRTKHSTYPISLDYDTKPVASYQGCNFLEASS